MKSTIFPISLSILLCLVFISSCKAQEYNHEEIDGGNIYQKDESAPKVINSKEIKEFYLNVYLAERIDINDNSYFEFEIKNNELTEKNSNRKNLISEQALNSIQEIIDKYSLVTYNGVYDVTSGLPPEYQPSTLDILYESGERLTFTQDNDPESKWATEIYDLFEKFFEEK